MPAYKIVQVGTPFLNSSEEWAPNYHRLQAVGEGFMSDPRYRELLTLAENLDTASVIEQTQKLSFVLDNNFVVYEQFNTAKAFADYCRWFCSLPRAYHEQSEPDYGSLQVERPLEPVIFESVAIIPPGARLVYPQQNF